MSSTITMPNATIEVAENEHPGAEQNAAALRDYIATHPYPEWYATLLAGAVGMVHPDPETPASDDEICLAIEAADLAYTAQPEPPEWVPDGISEDDEPDDGPIELAWQNRGSHGRGLTRWQDDVTGQWRYQKSMPGSRKKGGKPAPAAATPQGHQAPPVAKPSAKQPSPQPQKPSGQQPAGKPAPPAPPRQPQKMEMPNATITIEPPGKPAPMPVAPTAPPAPPKPAAPAPAAQPKAPPQQATPQQHAVATVMAKYKSQIKDAKFGPDMPAIRTVASTKESPLSAAEHKIVGQAHAMAGATYKKAGRGDLAEAHFAAARYHNGTAQKKTSPPSTKAAPAAPVKPPAAVAEKQAAHDVAQAKAKQAREQHFEAADKAEKAWSVYDAATGDARTALRQKMWDTAAEERKLAPVREAAEKEAAKAFGELSETKVDHEMAAAKAKGSGLTVDRAMQAATSQNIDHATKAKYHKSLTHATSRMPKNAERLLNMGLKSGFVFHAHADDVTMAADKRSGKNSFEDGTRTHGFFDPRDGSLNLDGESATPPSSSLMGHSFLMGAEEAMTGTFAHEMTHSIDHGGRVKTGKEFSADPEWIAAHDNESRNLSDYAATEIGESFAEFGRLVYGSAIPKDDVKVKFPLGYAFFKKHNLIDW